MATFTVRGKNIEITPSLREYVEKRVGKVTKYFGEEATMDMYTSIDLVVEKLERQIHKQKTKLSRRFRQGGLKAEAFKDATITAPRDEGEEYAVVKKKKFMVRPMDVQEAIMQMNLLNHNFFVYRDADTEEVNVVYRRDDGDYGLIESGE